MFVDRHSACDLTKGPALIVQRSLSCFPVSSRDINDSREGNLFLLDDRMDEILGAQASTTLPRMYLSTRVL